MHTLDLLEEALEVARSLGFCVRQEWLDGGGGSCELKGQRWLLVDLSLSTHEQLEQVLAAVRPEPQASTWARSTELRRLLTRRMAA